MDVTLVDYTPEDAARLVALQERNARQHPAAQVTPPEVYAQPAFAGGRRIPLAVDAAGALLGYAALYPQPARGAGARIFWAVIMADPEIRGTEPVRGALLARLLDLAQECLDAGTSHAEIRLDPAVSEERAIAYARAQGFERLHGVYRMARDLAEPLPTPSEPAGVACRPWKIAGEAEMRRYLAARNAAFPEGPWSLEGLQYFARSPQWAQGTTYSAFAPDGDLAGSVMAYWDPAPDGERPDVGYTEEVFVVPGWQRRGIASYLLAQALGFLAEHRVRRAHLQVSPANAGALDLYRRLGYRVVAENVVLARPV